MIDLIKPPTDNLYKFIAIAGLILIVGGLIYAPWLFYRSTLEELKAVQGQKEFEVQEKFAEERRKTLKERKDIVKAELEDLQNRHQKFTQPNTRTASSGEIDKLEMAIVEKRKTIESLEDALYELDLNLAMKNVQATSQNTFSLNESRNARLVMGFGLVIFVIGLVLTAVGFYMWYKRQQVIQDQILEMEANSRMNSGAPIATKSEEKTEKSTDSAG